MANFNKMPYDESYEETNTVGDNLPEEIQSFPSCIIMMKLF